jgi:hypothetical protein
VKTREQVKAIIEAAMVAADFYPRGTVGLDRVHTHNDIIVDGIFDAILSFNYDSFYDPTTAHPASPALWDTYISSATANGWTVDKIYCWNGTTWTEIEPVEGMLVWINDEDTFYKYDGSEWSKLISSNEVILTYSSAVTIDATAGDVFHVTLTGNITFNAPINAIAGKKVALRIKQGGSGSYTAMWNSIFRFSDDIPSPTLSLPIDASDYIGFIYNGVDESWDCVGLVQGVADV